jgi:lactoylglutathione lyase
MSRLQPIQSQITFLYYEELEPIAAFYENVLGFALVEDQQWAKIYRLGGNAYLGIVNGSRGFHRPQETNAVLVTLVVDDVPEWYAYLQERGVEMLSKLQHKQDIQVRCFFFRDPGGYTFEVQQFLKPELVEVFHR